VNAQIGRAAQHSVDEEAMHDNVTAVRRCGIGSNRIVGYRSTEPITTAFGIGPEQMLAIGVRLDAPELPDQASFDKDFVHRSTGTICAPKTVLARSHGPRRVHRDAADLGGERPDLDAQLAQERARHAACGHPGRGLARRRALQDVANVRVVVLERARQVAVAGPDPGPRPFRVGS